MPHASASETAFEDSIEASLLTDGGYTCSDRADWDRETALAPAVLFAFLRATQPDEWKRLQSVHGDAVETRFLARLVKELDNRGTLDVLRHGVIDYGVRFRLAYFRPATDLNADACRLYGANFLTVTRQLHFSKARPQDSVDMALFLNGLPIATLELKNHFTGQSAADARKQFIKDRDPREPLFAFKKRALAHFAVDPDEVWMTTKLNGRDTRFLPFNQGFDKGAGNPPNPDGYRSAYLWEAILRRDSLMDLLGRFLHVQTETLNFNGKSVKKEDLIFPRYHQIDAVRHLESNVRSEGVGKNYLIQHSAGSGKSNSIAWLAHGLSSLHDGANEPVFHSVIVISDRRVLDKQLQDTIYQFDHKQGVVLKIDKDSKQLADALADGVKIIITTLQKFPHVLNKIEDMALRKYAVIVDEAHSSQTGDAADAVKEALTNEYRAGADDETAEDVITRRMSSRAARHDNLSFFAFTATPKPKTMEVFGTIGADGKPHEAHLYSMRHAIEEGFIHDVLKGYMTYQRFFKLNKAADDDPRLDKKAAAKAIARFVNLHPHNISQKVEIIVEHFRRFVMQKIGGKAKAMVVTESRLAAVKYKQEVDHYLKEKGYTNIKALVAFSGTVTDDYNLEYTEAGLNGFSEKELPEKFQGEEYRLLLVAEKYQTGFDQPLLHTMYVDKKLSGVRAVQTLSRLNRTCPGKEDTFVLDFVNTPEEVQAAFQQYYENATIDQTTDANQLYDLKSKLDAFDVVREMDVNAFAEVFFRPVRQKEMKDSAALNRCIDPAVVRYRDKPEIERQEFKDLLATFLRLYSFLAQVMPFTDAELEKFYAYGRLLVAKLREESDASRWEISDEVALEYYRLQKTSEGAIPLEKNTEGALQVPSEVGTGSAEQDEEQLSAIIKILNERFGTEFTDSDQLFFEQIERDLSNDAKLQQQAQSNTIENFKYPFDHVFVDRIVERMEQNQEITDRIMSETSFSETVREYLLSRVYARLQDKKD